jgi:sec-independent protein translocase protein TatA
MENVLEAAMPGMGSMILILVAILLLFGGRKIPELMKGLGQGMKEFKEASKTDDQKKSSDSESEEKK